MQAYCDQCECADTGVSEIVFGNSLISGSHRLADDGCTWIARLPVLIRACGVPVPGKECLARMEEKSTRA